jgi:hypothetical protein
MWYLWWMVVIVTAGRRVHTLMYMSEPLYQWFSDGAPQEVARCAVNIMKVYFKNETKPICIEIFIHGLKYINIFLILYTKCARKFWYILQCAANQKKVWEPLHYVDQYSSYLESCDSCQKKKRGRQNSTHYSLLVSNQRPLALNLSIYLFMV